MMVTMNMPPLFLDQYQEGVTSTINWYLEYLKGTETSQESFYDQYGIKQ